jgi:nucleoside-diphosphate-sugar epimerase
MPAILVTGGSGFIGAAVVEALALRGDRVVAFDLTESGRLKHLRTAHSAIEFAAGELTEWPQLAEAFRRCRPGAVVHCAAIVGVMNSLASPIATMRVNIEGSLNVLAAMRLFDVKRLVNLSTEEVYGAFSADVIDESHPCRPSKPYGISKYAVEQLCRDEAATHGTSITHVRTCWVYGPGLPRPRIPKTLIDAALAGRPLHLPAGGDFRVDHVYVADVVQGILRALDAAMTPSDVYHIATGEAPSLGEIAEIVRDLVPAANIKIGPGHYAFADGVEPVRKGALDISRARRELGYEPRYDIRAGLAAYVEARRHGTG